MRNVIFSVLAVVVLVVGGFACGRAIADSGSAQMGSGSAVLAPAEAAPHTQLRDPLTDPAGAISEIDALRKKSWLGAVLVGLYGLSRLLGKLSEKFPKLEALNHGRVAMIIAASGTVLSGCVDAFMLDGKTSTVVVAAVYGLIGLLGTPKKP